MIQESQGDDETGSMLSVAEAVQCGAMAGNSSTSCNKTVTGTPCTSQRNWRWGGGIGDVTTPAAAAITRCLQDGSLLSCAAETNDGKRARMTMTVGEETDYIQVQVEMASC